MRTCDGFELFNIADEYMVVPIGKKAECFNGVVILNEPSAFLFRNMKENKTLEELVSLLTESYDVDKENAKKDIAEMLKELQDLGVIHD